MTQEWYRKFVNDMDRDMIFEILGAANYMNIKPLLDLACLRVTFELTGKSAEEVCVVKNKKKHSRNGTFGGCFRKSSEQKNNAMKNV